MRFGFCPPVHGEVLGALHAVGRALSRLNNAFIGTTQEVIADIRRGQEIGIHQLTFDFRSGRMDETLKIIEHFAAAVMPAVKG